jgi:hypothetical protein
MPMELFSVAMITSHRPSSAALPAKQRPETMPTRGASPLSAANRPKLVVSRPAAQGMSVSLGRPPPPSAKSTTGRRSTAASSSTRSSFLWLMPPCVPAKTV